MTTNTVMDVWGYLTVRGEQLTMRSAATGNLIPAPVRLTYTREMETMTWGALTTLDGPYERAYAVSSTIFLSAPRNTVMPTNLGTEAEPWLPYRFVWRSDRGWVETVGLCVIHDVNVDGGTVFRVNPSDYIGGHGFVFSTTRDLPVFTDAEGDQ